MALVGDDEVTTDVEPATSLGADPVMVVRLGRHLSMSMSMDQAQYLADALFDGLAAAEGAVSGPQAYVPAWHPV
jgi:hypothetical protein